MRASRTLFHLVVITFLLELMGYFLAEYGVGNIFLFHLYSWIEFFAIILIYYRINPSISWRHLLILLSFVFVFVSIISLLYFQPVNEFNSTQRVIEAALLGVILTRYLSECFKRDEISIQNPFFVLTAGFLIYFSGTLFLFSFGTEILQPESDEIWLIHGVFNILLKITFTVTLWKARIR